MKDSTTDRELLELAAKDADYAYEIDTLRDGSGRYRFRVNGAAWDPLTDDGDALRLAVKLDIQILRNTDGTVSGVSPTTGFWERIKEPLAPDAYAATRRAITRCAAEIGRSHHG